MEMGLREERAMTSPIRGEKEVLKWKDLGSLLRDREADLSSCHETCNSF